jgi:lactoylglutathione lyase
MGDEAQVDGRPVRTRVQSVVSNDSLGGGVDMTSMRTLSPGLRVVDLDASLAFYRALGFEVVGTVPETELGRLTMLKLPDDEFVSIELVASTSGKQDVDLGNGMSHLAVQVDSMDAAVRALREHHVEVGEPRSPDGTAGFLTVVVKDPDGRDIELVQWPPGHAAGLTAEDWK